VLRVGASSYARAPALGKRVHGGSEGLPGTNDGFVGRHSGGLDHGADGIRCEVAVAPRQWVGPPRTQSRHIVLPPPSTALNDPESMALRLDLAHAQLVPRVGPGRRGLPHRLSVAEVVES
jgi:hypothetical protein